MDSDLLLILVVATALGFDFTNGFHDTANVVATSISTRAVSPRAAVALAAVLNFAGAFISLKVAATIGQGIIQAGAITLPIIFAGLIGASVWNLATWYFGLPSSSSHALIGGVVGAMLAAHGTAAVQFDGLLGKVVIPALLSPVLAFVVAGLAIALGTYAGGWRIIRTMGTRIIKMDPAQGFTAQSAGAAVILAASHVGFPLSTTHVVAGGIMGAGAGKRVSAVRWGVAGNMAVAWVLTLPAAAGVGAAIYGVTTIFGSGVVGPAIIAAIALVALATTLIRRARELGARPAEAKS